MEVLVFDIETNGITDFVSLDELAVIHCLCIRDIRHDNVMVFNSDKGNIEEGLERLTHADVIVGHNILGFDIPAIMKLYPDWMTGARVIDTLVLSRLVWPDRRVDDLLIDDFPGRLKGSHSLRAWGVRLGDLKSEFGVEDTDWESWSPEMDDYCAQDVQVTAKLYQQPEMQAALSTEAVHLEHSFAEVIQKQCRNGIPFNEVEGMKLYQTLKSALMRIEEELQEIFPPKEEPMKTRAYWVTDNNKKFKTKKAAVEAGHSGTLLKPGPFRVKSIPFNPGSRIMIANAFIEKYGWKPTEFTNDGRPKVDETILRSLPYKEAEPLCEYLMLTKRIGQLGDGKESWLKLVKDGRIYGRVNTNGAVTGRCTHSSPNLAQVPSIYAPWGKDCRALFAPSDGKVMVGVDVSGLELRCLAHYLAKYDEGEYVKVILDGDIHSHNQELAGLPSRNKAKEFIYAFLYGAGDARLGEVVGGGRSRGRKLKDTFLRNLSALRRLRYGVDMAVENRGYLIGLDGRRLPIRSAHAALNTLLQSAGAVIVKQATVYMDRHLSAAGIDFKQVAHIHDEIQFECNPEDAEMVGKITLTSIQRAGDFFNLRCPLDGEYKIGNNWAETH